MEINKGMTALESPWKMKAVEQTHRHDDYGKIRMARQRSEKMISRRWDEDHGMTTQEWRWWYEDGLAMWCWSYDDNAWWWQCDEGITEMEWQHRYDIEMTMLKWIPWQDDAGMMTVGITTKKWLQYNDHNGITLVAWRLWHDELWFLLQMYDNSVMPMLDWLQ